MFKSNNAIQIHTEQHETIQYVQHKNRIKKKEVMLKTMTKIARTYRFELWEKKTLDKLMDKLSKDETAIIVLAIRELAFNNKMSPITPCRNMLRLEAKLMVNCKLYGNVSGQVKCLNCDNWDTTPDAPLQEQALQGWQIKEAKTASTPGGSNA